MVADLKAPSFLNQGLSSFMLYMVPLSTIFYCSFCDENLRVQSYDIFFAISHVDFVENMSHINRILANLFLQWLISCCLVWMYLFSPLLFSLLFSALLFSALLIVSLRLASLLLSYLLFSSLRFASIKRNEEKRSKAKPRPCAHPAQSLNWH